MRKTTSIAATAVAVLALTLTGCGDDKKDSKSSGTSDRAAARTSGKDGTASSPSAGASKSAGPSPSRTGAATKKPGISASPGPARTSAAAPAPAPTRTRAKTAAPTRPAASSSVQGTWYFPIRGQNGLATLTVSGTSWTMAYNGKSCSGTISASMAISSTCQGETSTGHAVVSNGGENLTFNWSSGNPDRFVRTKPTG